MSVDGRGWNLPVSTFCTGAFIGGRVKADDILRCCGFDSTAHSEHDRAGHSTHSRGTGNTEGGGAWPCTHRHRVWFLFCLSSQQACDFILRHKCFCCSRGMVPVPTVGLRASQFGTASEVPPVELAAHTPSPSDTHFSGGSVINTSAFARRHFGMFVSRWIQTQVHSTERSLSARCALGAR